MPEPPPAEPANPESRHELDAPPLPSRPALRLAHLYPDVMDIYGDRGNAIALKYRCVVRGIDLEVVPIRTGDAFEPSEFDLILIGGGQDREQRRIAADLAARGEAIRRAVDDGMPVLAVCGGFQLFGNRYIGLDGEELPGIGVFDMETRHAGPSASRCIGDVILATEFGEVVGFENHGGRTYLNDGQAPLGRVVRGHGNNGVEAIEGARRNNAVGTYLHGSLLPKNPALADALILAALQRRHGSDSRLPPIDDSTERAAHAAAVERARRSPAPQS